MDKLNLNIRGLTEKDYKYLENKIRELVYPIANQLQEKSSMVDSLQAQINSLKKSDEEQKVNNQLLEKTNSQLNKQLDNKIQEFEESEKKCSSQCEKMVI